MPNLNPEDAYIMDVLQGFQRRASSLEFPATDDSDSMEYLLDDIREFYSEQLAYEEAFHLDQEELLEALREDYVPRVTKIRAAMVKAVQEERDAARNH